MFVATIHLREGGGEGSALLSNATEEAVTIIHLVIFQPMNSHLFSILCDRCVRKWGGHTKSCELKYA